MPPVLDSLDDYKMLSERMNVLTIYLHRRKIGIASNLRIVKTAVHVNVRTFVHVLYYKVHKCEACVNRYSCFHHRACSSTKVNF